MAASVLGDTFGDYLVATRKPKRKSKPEFPVNI
jgi:hypothetical protein